MVDRAEEDIQERRGRGGTQLWINKSANSNSTRTDYWIYFSRQEFHKSFFLLITSSVLLNCSQYAPWCS